MIFETYECFVIKESPFLDFCSSDFLWFRYFSAYFTLYISKILLQLGIQISLWSKIYAYKWFDLVKKGDRRGLD